MSNIFNKSSDPQPISIIIQAPPKTGKTTLAMSLDSATWNNFPPKEPTQLKDVLVLNYDYEGYVGLQSLNMECEVVDFRKLLTPWSKEEEAIPEKERRPFFQNIVQAHTFAFPAIQKKVREGAIKYIVVDTLSSMAQLIEECCPSSMGSGVDWMKAPMVHLGWLKQLKSLNVHLIFLSHIKAIAAMSFGKEDANTALTKAKLEASGITDLEGVGLGMLVSGDKVRAVYTGSASGIFELRDKWETPPGGKKRLVRNLHLQKSNSDISNRFQAYLDDVEEPNLHKLFVKAKIIKGEVK